MCLCLSFLTNAFNCLTTSKHNIPRALLCVHITGLNKFNNDNSFPKELSFEEKQEGTQKLSPTLGRKLGMIKNPQSFTYSWIEEGVVEQKYLWENLHLHPAF